jgi:hypothetical protein
MADIKSLTNAIRRMKEQYPDMRIGQLVVNVASWAHGSKTSAIWDMTDDEFVRTVENHLAKKKAP